MKTASMWMKMTAPLVTEKALFTMMTIQISLTRIVTATTRDLRVEMDPLEKKSTQNMKYPDLCFIEPNYQKCRFNLNDE